MLVVAPVKTSLAGSEFELVLEPGFAPLQDVGPIPLRRMR
jgi:hypothetical protein